MRRVSLSRLSVAAAKTSWLCVSLTLAGACMVTPAQGATPVAGRAYLAASSGTHNVWYTDFSWNGTTFTASTPVVIATLPTAADVQLLADGSLAVAGQGDYCGGCIYHVDSVSGQYQTHNAQNNNNTLSLDPTKTVLYAGWVDTNISTLSVAGGTMSDGSPHIVTGGDGVATSIAFTPGNGAFYVTGGVGFGNFGRIDLSSFTTTRLLSNVPGAVVAYDPFSDSLILAGGGTCYQVHPGDPSNVVSMRSDTATDNYIELQPDGLGHLFGTICCGGGGIVIIDYSASGLIGDSSTRIGHALLPTIGGLSGGLAVTVHASCGSADFNCDGDIGTDQDIEAFFACLSGVCPSPPCANSADFNGDGDVGTDADIEAFFRVLGGGNC